MMFNETKIILDLCGGSGSWSQPYVEAGYDVELVTLPIRDVRVYFPPENVYGVLCAPPCTVFSNAGAWVQRSQDEILQALSVVDACLRIVAISNPVFWCLENPVGKLGYYLGKPRWTFDPYEYGDPYTKHTCLWGKFNIPARNPVPPVLGSKMHTNVRSPAKRAITPPGFAQAFFEANR